MEESTSGRLSEEQIDKRVAGLFGEPWGKGRLAKAMGMDETTGRANVIHRFIDSDGREVELDPACIYEFEPSLVQTDITYDRVLIFSWKVKAI